MLKLKSSDSFKLVLKERRDEVDKIMAAMTPVNGEMRCVYQCGHCDRLFGCRFIPYGLGRGMTINACSCVITNNCQSMHVIDEREP